MNFRAKPGDKNPNAKLNWEKVREIREKSKNGESRAKLCEHYGVALRTIASVVNREKWREDGSVYMPSGFNW